jgi:lysophospholipase L1-like esterase
VLLLIPIVHLVYLVSQDTMAALDTSPQAWADEVEAYLQADQSTSLPSDPIVVIGDRGVKLWRGLEDILAPQPVLMRGLGGATVNDITHYHSQLISFYRPSAVVLLPGVNEFHVRDNKSAPELASAIRKLVDLDLSYEPARQFYVIAPIKNPLYPGDHGKIDQVTQLLQDWAGAMPQVTIVDANSLLSRANGQPNPDNFRMDGVNLNEHGYLRLSLLLQERLEEEKATLYSLDTLR